MWRYLQSESEEGHLMEVLNWLQISILLPLEREGTFDRRLAPFLGADSAPSGMRMVECKREKAWWSVRRQD